MLVSRFSKLARGVGWQPSENMVKFALVRRMPKPWPNLPHLQAKLLLRTLTHIGSARL